MSSTLNTTAAEIIGNTLQASEHDAQDSRSALSPDASAALASFGWDGILDVQHYVQGFRLSTDEQTDRALALIQLHNAGLIATTGDKRFVRLTDAGRRALFPAEL